MELGSEIYTADVVVIGESIVGDYLGGFGETERMSSDCIEGSVFDGAQRLWKADAVEVVAETEHVERNRLYSIGEDHSAKAVGLAEKAFGNFSHIRCHYDGT